MFNIFGPIWNLLVFVFWFVMTVLKIISSTVKVEFVCFHFKYYAIVGNLSFAERVMKIDKNSRNRLW